MMQAIQAPDTCPSCSSPLTWVNNVLYCRNNMCDARTGKKLEHFAKTLKIKGLGPAAIKKLDIQDFDEIYSLTEEEISASLDSEKLASKLYAEIQNSRSAPLELVLPAFGIPLIGNTATKKLSAIVSNMFEINRDACTLAGLGPKATESLCDWLDKEYYSFYDGFLPFSFKFSEKDKVTLHKGTVCISGKLKSFNTKADATKALNDAGYDVKSSLTKQVTILLNESEIESSKTKQARDSGIKISTNIHELLEI